jgi:hypothetical protein
MSIIITDIQTLYGIQQAGRGVFKGAELGNIEQLSNAWLSIHDGLISGFGKMETIAADVALSSFKEVMSVKGMAKKTAELFVSNIPAFLDFMKECGLNQLLEKVRSQIASNSRQISSINTDITPIQKAYLNVMESGIALNQTKSASVVSLEDYNELYRTTVFGTVMYVVGAGLILYLLYKPRIQSQY